MDDRSPLREEVYRNIEHVHKLTEAIERAYRRPLRLMEVCGTHTMSIYRYGIRALLPEGVDLVSGPGCPVCVTDAETISAALALAQVPGVIFTTYGDMLRVPAGDGSLQQLRENGADVRIVLSPLDALALAEADPARQVVFFGIGFETTAPLTAATLLRAKIRGVKNFSVFSAHKTMPNVLRTLLAEAELDGLLCPGHVAAITGAEAFRFVPDTLHKGAAVSGFEPVDILQAILALVEMANAGRAELKNCYPRAVRDQGNPRALELLAEVFRSQDAAWRGLGVIPDSGLGLSEAYRDFDASHRFAREIQAYPRVQDDPACRCGLVLQGKVRPEECPIFGRRCTPLHPCGACMVSSEGACAAAYKYRRIENEQ